MSRRLLFLLPVAGSLLFFGQCASVEVQSQATTSHRAIRLEKAEPLLLNSGGPNAATASAAEAAVEVPRSSNEYRAMLEAANALLASTPGDVQMLLVRAKAKSQLKDYDAAIADCNTALRLAPASASGFYQRGLNRLKMKQYPAAIADLTKAIQYNPEYKEAFFGRGAARMQTLNFRAALPDFSEAIRLDSTYADAYEYRGISYASLNKTAEAKADLEKATQLNPKAERSLRRYVEK